ncbi:MAG: 4-hydroxyphenylpyruvate dioxygenase [Proteobacteria bacterium]|nr:4-hydroxyphenylpyruvate dioxygenase [Pseudomonadota bacterium]
MDQAQDNPIGTDGFDFVEYAAGKGTLLQDLFTELGFSPVARHKSKNITLYRQGGINFLLNAQKEGFAAEFAKTHGPSACAMGFRVANAEAALIEVQRRGASKAKVAGDDVAVPAPCIEAIGGARIYLVDRYNGSSIYEDDYEFFADSPENDKAAGLTYIDHLTHNVFRGNLDKWCDFYIDLFDFTQIRYFDIDGAATGLISRAMGSPCGKICIPINESKDDRSQIAEYLEAYHGEGIQHIALGTDDIYGSVVQLKANGVDFQETPDTYYELLEERIADHREDSELLQKLGILLDGERNDEVGLLLQIFTQEVIGPIFFEVIQRKGNKGFGEGNFNALFKSIELDQVRRGVLKIDEPAAE